MDVSTQNVMLNNVIKSPLYLPIMTYDSSYCHNIESCTSISQQDSKWKNGENEGEKKKGKRNLKITT